VGGGEARERKGRGRVVRIGVGGQEGKAYLIAA
jgi:hypothetical protein